MDVGINSGAWCGLAHAVQSLLTRRCATHFHTVAPTRKAQHPCRIAAKGGRRIVGVQGRKARDGRSATPEPRFGRFFYIADFADHDRVGIVAQDGTKITVGRSKTRSRDEPETELPRNLVLSRILHGQHAFVRGITGEQGSHRAWCSARTCRTGHQNHAIGLRHPVLVHARGGRPRYRWCSDRSAFSACWAVIAIPATRLARPESPKPGHRCRHRRSESKIGRSWGMRRSAISSPEINRCG